MNDVLFPLCCYYPIYGAVCAWTACISKYRGSNDLYIMLMVRLGLKRILFYREESGEYTVYSIAYEGAIHMIICTLNVYSIYHW